jgi:hypothetical protein
MTDRELTTLVREHVIRDEPPFLLDPSVAIGRGRRTLRRRRALTGLAGAAVVVAAAVVVPQLGPASGGTGTTMDPATAYALQHYDARRMPELMLDRAGGVLRAAHTDLGAGTFTASDSQDASLPAEYYDKASSMSVAYGNETDHRFMLSLAHSAGEAEGGAERNCRNDLAGGIYFSCEVSTTANGDVVTTRVGALRRDPTVGGWAVLTPDELRTDKVDPMNGNQEPIDPADVWFSREVKSVHSMTFVSYAAESVRAPDLSTAEESFAVPVTGLIDLATDPALVIPKPPIQSNGCAWTLHPDQIDCGVEAPAGTGGS